MLLVAVFLLAVRTEAALKIGGLVSAGHSRTKELLEEIIKERSSNLPTQNRMHPEIAYVEANATFAISNTACSQIGQGVSAVISSCSGTVHETLNSLSKSLNLPYINTAPDVVDSAFRSRAAESDEKEFTIVLAPSTAKATADLIHSNKWRDIYFIYDKPEGLDELEHILAELPRDAEVEVKGLHQVTSNSSALNYLQEVENAAWDVEKHFILAMDVKMAKRVVELAYRKKRAYSHFIVPRFTVKQFWSDVRMFDQSTVASFQIIDEIEFKNMKSMRGGVSTPKNPEDENVNEEEAFLMDAGQLLAETVQAISREQPVVAGEIFKELSQIQASVSCYRTPLEPYAQGRTIVELMRKIRFKGSTGQVRFNERGRRTEYQLSVVELTSNSEAEKVGSWSDREGLRFLNEHERQARRSRVKQDVNKNIIITTIIERPFLFFKDENDTRPHIDNVDGYIKDLIERVMRDIPGRPQFDIHFVKDGKFGYKDPKQASGWNGLIGEVLRKDADIAIAPLTVTTERAKVVHFSQPFMSSGIAAIAHNGADDLFNIRTPFAFLRPLDYKIWLCFLGAYLVVATILLIINLINLAVATPPVDPPTPCRHFYNSVWYAFGMFMSEECNNCRPKSLGSRVIGCSWWLFIFCFLSIYTAQLWINEPFSPTGENLPKCTRELLYQNEIEYGLVRGSVSEDFFRNTDDEEYKEMYKRMLSFNDSVIGSYSKAIDRIRNNSRFIVFADSNLVRYTSAREPCDTIQVGTDLRRSQYAIATSKHFALRRKIDEIITSLRDEGFLEHLESKWFGEQALDCPSETPVIAPSFLSGRKKSEVARPLGVRRVLGWFFILGLGLLIALFITICEVYCKKPKKIRSPEEIAERRAAREAKKNKKSKKDKAEEVETQQLTAHEAPIGNSQIDDGASTKRDDATLKKRGIPREMKIDEEYPADDGGFKRTELPPIADVEPFTDTDSRCTTSYPTMVDQAIKDKLEAGFAKLQGAADCKSLVKKYLTRQVLDELKDKKTAMGATLLDVVQSGMENLDSGVGVYAPDAESYKTFAPLFDPIIDDYHQGFKPTDKHPQSDFGDLNQLVNVDPEGKFVISTRVRCGRSLQGYPFNPCLTENQYKEMEAKVSSTLKALDGELKGTYYPLTGMDKATQQQLIDDHFLFKEGDRFLQAANACRYWPAGRGIYHNDAKTFLVWCNEEDHLRIISMQKGGDLKQVFGRLTAAVKAIEAKLPFSRDDRLGYLTFCPTNLGTTIRASVHIALPKLAADRAKLEEIASKYSLQVRGTRGEHTESEGGVYDISNKRRMGLTEFQAVKEMQDGILEMIKMEKAAA
ncbi:glutamate receptor 3 [Galendromus occidentalis]|uniref:Arginine kinase n=1 Tax=Galendromus occidentalis TaxID=34638 RepID=A0AAJ7L403_9ACAR|nr:glutamate receptor 3 [Galendromus occidentalis]